MAKKGLVEVVATAPAAAMLRRGMLFLFFVTGGCGLIYEVVWTRLLRLVMGNTTYSITTVLCAFMGGMALGSYVGGRIADRRKDPLRVFAVIQAVIALYCFLLPWLIDGMQPLYRSLYRTTQGAGYLFSLIQFAFSGSLLLVPATLMGATLPVLSRFFVQAGRGTGRPVGVLYAVNTFGAMAGAFATGFLLIPSLGLSKTIYLGCLLSLFAAIASFLLHSRRPPADAAAPGRGGTGASPVIRTRGKTTAGTAAPQSAGAPQAQRAEASYGRAAMACLLVGYALAGAAAMIYEIGWTRVLSLLIGSSVYAFSLMLTAFVFGLAAGSMLFARFVDRLRDPMRALGIIELLAGGTALAVLPFIDRLPVYVALWIARYGGAFWQLQFVEFALALLIMLIPTLLMGAAFPLANRLFAAGKLSVARAVGSVSAANTLGCILGSFAGGFLLIPALGIQRALFTAVGLNALVGGVFLWLGRGSSRTKAAAVAVSWAAILLAVVSIPAWDQSQMSFGPYLWARKLGKAMPQDVDVLQKTAYSGKVVFHKEGLTTTVTVTRSDDGISLKVNGKNDASTRSEDMYTQKLLAHVPILLHPGPRRVLVIGLASGITLGSAGVYPVASLDCAEIAPEMADACRCFDAYNHRVLDDPRTRLIVADGRNHLALTDRTYDVITSEPSNPWIAGIADLFTVEFFRLCRDRLNDGGVACIWLEGYNIDETAFRSVVRTFQSVFPDTMLWSPRVQDYLLIGFKGPARVDASILAVRLARPAVAADLQPLGIRTPADFLSYCIMSGPAVSDFAGDAPIHTDDNALLEFSTPRTMIANVGEKSFFETIACHHRPDLSFLTGRDPQALAALKGQAERGMRARGHAMLGLALILQKHTDQGQALLAQAADLNPADPVLNGVLDNQLAQAAALIQRRQVAEAAGACEKILSLNPRHAGAHFMLGRLLRQQGQANLALEHFCQAADAAPQDLRAAYAAAMMAGDLGKVDLAVRYYRRTLQLKDDHAEAMISLAWALLSDPTSSAANAPEAVHLAKRACQLTANKDPKAFDALGVAYAALGNFTDARSAAAQALALAEQAGNPRLIEAFQKRLDLYTSNLRNPTSRERP